MIGLVISIIIVGIIGSSIGAVIVLLLWLGLGSRRTVRS